MSDTNVPGGPLPDDQEIPGLDLAGDALALPGDDEQPDDDEDILLVVSTEQPAAPGAGQ
jgi:hypothetical protein